MSVSPPVGFKDPNAQLLASVVPPPPPSAWARAGRRLSTLRAPSLRSVVRWSRSREARDCCIAALVGAGLMIAFYRSEASSKASTTKATTRVAPLASAPLGTRASSPAAPAVLAERAPSPAARPAAPGPATVADADDAITSRIADAAEADPTDSVEAPKTAATSASKQRKAEKRAKKRLAKNKQKSKRPYAARSSSRTARHAKNQRVTTPGPLGAWLATRSRSDEANAAKRR